MDSHFGLLHLYHGEGKGKTTCAMGLALRCAAHGKKVLVVQFLKDGTSGEVVLLAKLPQVTLLAGKATQAFSWNMTPEERTATTQLHQDFLTKIGESSFDLLVLDEICGALSNKLVDASLVEQVIRQAKESGREVVATGRNPQDFLVELADYSTCFTLERHPYQQGIPARKGIEF